VQKGFMYTVCLMKVMISDGKTFGVNGSRDMEGTEQNR